MRAERRGGLARLWTHRRNLPILGEALCSLAMARLSLKLRPFNAVAGSLTRPVASPATSSPELSSRWVRWAVLAMAKRLPWRSVCFDQAIAAQRMLRRRGIAAEIVYGVRRMDAGLDAHVWLRLPTGWIVVGGEQAPLFQPIARFQPGRKDISTPPLR